MSCRCRHSQQVPQAPSFARRLRALAGCVLPAAALAFAPKCPVCIAAYLSLLTGLGISAAWVQTAQWIGLSLSAIAFVYLLGRAIAVRLKQK